MDKLIRAVNEDGRVNVFYSTPKRYVDAKHAEHRLGARAEQQAFPVKGDDFFPYADQPHAYWTGYFTSRPTHKFYNRYASAYLAASAGGLVVTLHMLGMRCSDAAADEVLASFVEGDSGVESDAYGLRWCLFHMKRSSAVGEAVAVACCGRAALRTTSRPAARASAAARARARLRSVDLTSKRSVVRYG